MPSVYRYGFLVLAALFLLVSQPFSSALGLPLPYPPIASSGWQELELLLGVNEARSNAGVPALQADEALALAARHHALEMAELSYLDHESPRAENRTLRDRLARAGALVQAAGENLALLADDATLTRRTISGWLDSPGHRQNLLAAEFTHVGFGVARNTQGEVWVVQVLGRKKLDLVRSDVQPAVLETRLLQIDFQLLQSAEVAFWLGGEHTQPASFAAGRHSVAYTWNPQATAQVYAGVRSAAGAAFIRMDGGWFEPATGSWSPGTRNGSEELLIESVQPAVQRFDVWRVDLGLADVPRSSLGMWIDGEWQHGLEAAGRNLQFDVPRGEPARLVEIGLLRSGSEQEYEIALRFSVEAQADGQARVKIIY